MRTAGACAPASDINFMIARQGRRPLFGADRSRDLRRSRTRKDPGYREIPVKWDLEGQHDGIEQTIAKGSWVDISRAGAARRGPIALCRDDLADLARRGQAGGAELGWRGGSLDARHREPGAFGSPRPRRASSRSTPASRSPSGPGTISPACSIRRPGSLRSRRRRARSGSTATSARRNRDARQSAALAGAGAAAIAAERAGQGVVHHFNGKIERPRITDGGAGLDGLTRRARLRRRGAVRSPNGISPSASRPTSRPISVLPRRTAPASTCRRAR